MSGVTLVKRPDTPADWEGNEYLHGYASMWFGDGDEYGSAMLVLGGIAEVVYDADPHSVPTAWGYSPAWGGPEVPTESGREMRFRLSTDDCPAENVEAWRYLHQAGERRYSDGLPYFEDSTFAGRVAELVEAGNVLSRIVDWCRETGRDY